MKLLSSFLIVGGLSGIASANAFLINEHDAKQVGRGNASTATDDDPSSIYYNIGGLAVQDGTNVQIGGSLVVPMASYTDPNTMKKSDTDASAPVLPQLFISSRVHPMVAVGVGVYLPFGLSIAWPDSSGLTDVAKSQDLRTYFITPSVGVNLGSFVPGLTAGAGLDIVPATVELKQNIFFGDVQGTAHLAGDAVGIGGRIGVMYRPDSAPKLSVGAMFRTQVTEDFSGNGNFNIADPFRSQLPPDGKISTSVTLPMSVQGGVAYRVMPDLDISADAVWVNWSKFKEIRIKLPGGAPDTVQPQNYSDTVTVRVGGEYKLPMFPAAVRAGFIYDPTPIPSSTLSATLPDADRYDLTLGGGMKLAGYDLNLGLLWVLPTSRKTGDTLYMPVHKGTYDIQAFVASLTLGAHFGK